jgi:hypothetical protein
LQFFPSAARRQRKDANDQQNSLKQTQRHDGVLTQKFTSAAKKMK